MSNTAFRDYLQLHLVVLAWGLTAILGKLIHLPPVDVVLARTALAACGFALVAGNARLGACALPRGKLMGVGAVLGLHWILFFWAARLSTASVCLAALPTAMLWSSLIEPWIDGTKKWRPAELVVGCVMVGAVWLIYKFELRYWVGFSVAIACALLAALFATLSKQQVTRNTHWSVISFYQMIGAFAAAVLCRPLLENGLLPELPDWRSALWLLVLALVCTVGAYGGFIDVLSRVSVFTVNLIYNMEPVYGIVLAALVFGRSEFMSGGFYLGAGIIVTVVLAVPWVRRWVEKT